MSKKIHVDYYPSKQNSKGDEGYKFKFTEQYKVNKPCLEICSKKHGHITLDFGDGGDIEITFWSGKIPENAEHVVPAKITLRQ